MNYQLAAELNNLGGAYLQAGHLKKSMELFRDALRYTLCDLQPQEAPACPCSPVASAASASGKYGYPSTTNASQPAAAIEKPSYLYEVAAAAAADGEVVTPSPSSVPFVHSHAINIIPSPNAYSPDPLINTTIVSSIVLFNLGIVYHLKGLEGSGEAIARLAKARSLYQKSQLLLVDAGVPQSSTGNPVIDMLSMALYNNLAQASFEMFSYKDSRRYFEHLIRFALTVVPSRYGDATVATLVDQQKSNFLLNAIILHAPKLAAAA